MRTNSILFSILFMLQYIAKFSQMKITNIIIKNVLINALFISNLFIFIKFIYLSFNFFGVIIIFTVLIIKNTPINSFHFFAIYCESFLNPINYRFKIFPQFNSVFIILMLCHILLTITITLCFTISNPM